MTRMTLVSGVLLVATAAMAGPIAAQGATSGPACISSDDVRGAEVLDNRTVVFHMGDGNILLNHLTEPCDGLPSKDGFYHGIRANTIICAEHDVVRIREHSVCKLGAFTDNGWENPARDLRDPAHR